MTATVNIMLPETISSFKQYDPSSAESTNQPLTVIGSAGVRQTPDVDMVKKPAAPASLSKNKKPKTRSPTRVQFAVDTSNELLCTVNGDRVELTEEEVELMWWQAEEAALFRKRAKHASRVYQSAGTTCPYTISFKRAIDLCSSSAGSRIENVPLVSNTPARGLEPYVFPELTHKRRKVIRTIVNAQRKLPDGLHPEQKAQLLNAASKSLTRSARRMSRVLAIGDANVAAQSPFNFDEL
jgi:hypothetical protein